MHCSDSRSHALMLSTLGPRVSRDYGLGGLDHAGLAIKILKDCTDAIENENRLQFRKQDRVWMCDARLVSQRIQCVENHSDRSQYTHDVFLPWPHDCKRGMLLA